MGVLLLRRLLVWSVLLLALVTLGLALTIVWTANEREWFVDTAGVSATLDMTLTSAGRWIATALLGGLVIFVLLAFIAELATEQSNRTPQPRPFTEPFAIPEGTMSRERESSRRAATVDEPTEQIDRGRYSSMVVGDEATQRMERPLASDQGSQNRIHSGEVASKDDSTFGARQRTADDDSDAWRRPADRMRSAEPP